MMVRLADDRAMFKIARFWT